LTEIDKCAASPAQCNLYGYAANNPVSHVDPTGTEKEPTIGATSGDVSYTSIDKVRAAEDFEGNWFLTARWDRVEPDGAFAEMHERIYGPKFAMAMPPTGLKERIVAYLEGLEMANPAEGKGSLLATGQQVYPDGVVIELSYELVTTGPSVEGSAAIAKQSTNMVTDKRTVTVEASVGGTIGQAPPAPGGKGAIVGGSWGAKVTGQKEVQKAKTEQVIATMNFKFNQQSAQVKMYMTVKVPGQNPVVVQVRTRDTDSELVHTVQRPRAPGQR
jgi:hypothetical protein